MTERRGVAALTGVLLAACATNPVTGRSELALVSESQEIAMGKQGAADVAQSIGLYADGRVQSYVSGLGLSLAARTERPNLPWAYQVVDDPTVNAFALPGGFIFVTRGLLTHMTSEAELATVLGHESGHVAARHSVQQISRSQLAQFGLGIGSVLSSGIRKYSEVAGAGLGLLFLKFSRDDETQADQLGFRYALTDGYDVREMAGVFQMLDQQAALSGAGRLPEWQATHPNPGNRIKATNERVAAAGVDLSTKKIGREEFLKLIDGMIYGENPRLGFFQGPFFRHPELKFQFRFPDGWKTQNGSSAVIAGSPAQDALIELRVAAGTAAQASQKFFAQQGLAAGTVSPGTIHGFSTLAGEFSAQTEQGAIRGIATFIDYSGTTYQVTGYTTGDKFGSYSALLRQSAATFDRLTDPAALAVQPMRLRIERAPRAMSLGQFNVQFPSRISLDQVALINGIGTTGQLRSGQMVKRVVGTSPQ
ncbi:MAG: M48 family metalloprotease [Gemmatimonadales bacterium]|nr:M48 family metalloprotease [Gemmatimonadales bacterium]